MPVSAPERIDLATGLNISRIVTGLWQVADMERDGRTLDFDSAAGELARYAEAGFDTFDMADHYGSAKEIRGRLNDPAAADEVKPADKDRPPASPKWCPMPGVRDGVPVRGGIERSLKRIPRPTIAP